MMRELAHRRRAKSQATYVVVETDTSAQAIEQVRQGMPAEHVILFVRAIDRVVPGQSA